MTYVTILLIAAILVILLFKWKRQHGTDKPITEGKGGTHPVAAPQGCYDHS